MLSKKLWKDYPNNHEETLVNAFEHKPSKYRKALIGVIRTNISELCSLKVRKQDVVAPKSRQW